MMYFFGVSFLRISLLLGSECDVIIIWCVVAII